MYNTSLSELHKKFDSLGSKMETSIDRIDRMTRSSPDLERAGVHWAQPYNGRTGNRQYPPRNTRGPPRDPALTECWICGEKGHRSGQCPKFTEAKEALEKVGAKINRPPGTAWMVKYKNAKQEDPGLKFLDYLRQHYMESDYAYSNSLSYRAPNPIYLPKRPPEAYQMPYANQPVQVIRQQAAARVYHATDLNTMEDQYYDDYEDPVPVTADTQYDMMPDGTMQITNTNS